MPTQADIDALYSDTAPSALPDNPSPQWSDYQASVDALYGDHPSAPGVTSPPPAPAAGASGPPPAPGPQDSDGIFTRPIARTEDFLGRTWHSLKDAWTGAGKTEFPDQPELTEMPSDAPGQPSTGQALRLTGAYLTGSTPEQIAEIATKALPGSTLSKDKFGNLQITNGGKTYYVKKPGFSPADLATALGLVGTSAAVATGVGAVPALAGTGVAATGARMVAQGLGQAGVSVGRDLGASALGSDQGVSAGRAAEAGVGGAVGEPIAAGVAMAGRLIGNAAVGTWRSLFGYGGRLLGDVAGAAATDPVTPAMLTRTGQVVLERAGVAPGTLTVGQIQAAEDALGQSGAKAIAYAPPATGGPAATRVLQSARSGIPMTTGQITGDPMQLALEDRLRQAASPATQTMRDFGTQQTDATTARATALIPGAQPGVAAPTEAELGQALIAQTTARADAMRQATTNAYTRLPFLTRVGMAAQPGAPSATFSSGTSAEILNEMQQIAQRHAIYEATPAARQAQHTISRLVTVPSQDMAPGVEGVAAMNGVPAPTTQAMVRPFNVGDLDTTLRQLNSLYDSAATDGDRAAVNAMRRAVHDRLDAAALNGSISGNPQVLQDWQNARATSRSQLEFLQPDSTAVRGFMDRVTGGQLTGQEAINGLYGAGQIGTKGGTQQMLDHLQTQFQPGTPEYQTLQQAAVRRMLFGSTEKTAEMSPNNIANRITEATTGNGQEITGRLLDPATVNALTEFRDTMRTLQQSARQNPSGTAYTAANALKALGARIPIVGAAFRDEGLALRQARAAVAPGIPSPLTTRPTDLPLGLVRRTLAPTAGAVVQQTSPQAPPPSLVRYPYAATARFGGLLGHLVP